MSLINPYCTGIARSVTVLIPSSWLTQTHPTQLTPCTENGFTGCSLIYPVTISTVPSKSYPTSHPHPQEVPTVTSSTSTTNKINLYPSTSPTHDNHSTVPSSSGKITSCKHPSPVTTMSSMHSIKAVEG